MTTFLEAHRIVGAFTGGTALRVRLAMSGSADPLLLYVRAAAAVRGRRAEIETLPFNTFAQAIAGGPRGGAPEVLLLMPWDFMPECDWRSGLPAEAPAFAAVIERMAETAARLARREAAAVLYVPAPLMPVFPDALAQARLEPLLTAHALAVGARLLPAETASIETYFSSGCPIASARLGTVAEAIVETLLRADAPPERKKVLVTDLDNVVWRGVVAEDGLEGIACDAAGAGFVHFVYQTCLAAVKADGALLVAVSRNSPDDAMRPFRAGRTMLREEDFVAVLASYDAKSAQIRAMADRLNLPRDAFVFVDDNPVELAEVGAALPEVTCVPFAADADGLPALVARLRQLFARTVVTVEDRERTVLYRRRLEGIAPAHVTGADLTEFLRGLRMRLLVREPPRGGDERAIQLINKTNQFNINGRRFAPAEVHGILDGGGRLYTAALSDRTGHHGEILACLVASDGTVEAFVLSCRVFQRRVEHAFLVWLAGVEPPASFRVAATARNEPARRLLADPAFAPAEAGCARFDAGGFAARHAGDLDLFELQP